MYSEINYNCNSSFTLLLASLICIKCHLCFNATVSVVCSGFFCGGCGILILS